MLNSLSRIEKMIQRIEYWVPPETPKPKPLYEWLRGVSPNYRWNWNYLQEVIRFLSREGPKRLMVFLPPRHGKSSLVTVRYPVWLMEQKPGLRVIVSAYNQTLANRFSRWSRNFARRRIGLKPERSAVEEWETVNGCWYRAVGVLGGITGTGADLIIIDDPVKSREEAESKIIRDRIWDWYTNDLYTRLEPQGSIVLIMTRWHEDDLAGRILTSSAKADWTVLRFPAIAEENDPLGRKPGEALNPDRYSLRELEKIREVIGSWAFEALYQQRPVALEGGLFRREWLSHFVEAVPAQVEKRVRYWDKAATAGAGDYTAGVRMSRTADNLFYIEDVVRGRWSPGERDKVIQQCAMMDPEGTQIWIEQEPGSSGIDSIHHLISFLSDYPVYGDRVTGSKQIRAEPFAAQCEAGNVRIVRGSWNAEFIEELTLFPKGQHDDQIDAASGAYNKLRGPMQLEYAESIWR